MSLEDEHVERIWHKHKYIAVSNRARLTSISCGLGAIDLGLEEQEVCTCVGECVALLAHRIVIVTVKRCHLLV